MRSRGGPCATGSMQIKLHVSAKLADPSYACMNTQGRRECSDSNTVLHQAVTEVNELVDIVSTRS